MNENVTIRAARADDAQALLEIYAWYVENTALSYEYDVPDADEFRGRIINIMKQYPYLVAERDGKLLGYAYASRYRERAAYAWNAETAIYLRRDARNLGLGRALYGMLEEILRAQGVVKLVANVTAPVDEFSDFGSLPFHERMGFNVAGRMDNCGYKFDRWYSTVNMDKLINTPESNMCPIKSFDEVRESFNL